MSKKERAKEIDRAIRLTWESLQSHLKYCYEEIDKGHKKQGETNEFHKQCVRDYAETLLILSKLY